LRLVVIGGSDAGIGAALRARELAPAIEVVVVLADAYPNFSICGIPYYISGDVADWRDLAHRTIADLEATGIELRLNTIARRIDVEDHRVALSAAGDDEELLDYDALVVATGAQPIRPPIEGLDQLRPSQGVHLLHSMEDTFAVVHTLQQHNVRRAVIVGAGYVGLEMAEALSARGISVTQFEQLSEVLPTVDPELGALVHGELERHGVEVACRTRVEAIRQTPAGSIDRLEVIASDPDDRPVQVGVDLVLVSVGVRPDSQLAGAAGAELGIKDAIAVDRQMRTNLPDVLAAGDCVITHHPLIEISYLPLGTTAHKQGRIAGENAVGGSREFAGSLGTQVVKVFDLAAARTGLRDHEASAAGFDPVTVDSEADDHKAYYPGSHRIAMRYTGDRHTGRLLGVQLVGRLTSEIAKRIDIPAAAIFNRMTVDAISDLDLSYTPPLGSPWDALQVGAQAWSREVGLSTLNRVPAGGRRAR
jgi:NADPH-dependent 2,4-dienoyl-CoA reductase/sulfur reductase-like enzyme